MLTARQEQALPRPAAPRPAVPRRPGPGAGPRGAAGLTAPRRRSSFPPHTHTHTPHLTLHPAAPPRDGAVGSGPVGRWPRSCGSGGAAGRPAACTCCAARQRRLRKGCCCCCLLLLLRRLPRRRQPHNMAAEAGAARQGRGGGREPGPAGTRAEGAAGCRLRARQVAGRGRGVGGVRLAELRPYPEGSSPGWGGGHRRLGRKAGASAKGRLGLGCRLPGLAQASQRVVLGSGGGKDRPVTVARPDLCGTGRRDPTQRAPPQAPVGAVCSAGWFLRSSKLPFKDLNWRKIYHILTDIFLTVDSNRCLPICSVKYFFFCFLAVCLGKKG